MQRSKTPERLLAQAQVRVESIKQIQRELTFLSEDEAVKRAELVSLSKQLENGIINVANGQVFLNGELVEGVSLSDRLSATVDGVDFSTAIAGAVSLAKTLQISVVAAASLQNLQASINSGSGRGQDPRLFMDGGRLAGNASNAAAALERVQKQIDAAAKSAASGSRATGGLSKAMKAAAKDAEKLADEIQRLEFDADPMAKYTAELEHLDELLAAGLSDGAYQHALQDLNDELRNQNPLISDLSGAWKDFAVNGFKDFSGFVDKVKSSFANMLYDMIFAAKSNKIMLNIVWAAADWPAPQPKRQRWWRRISRWPT